MRILLDTHALLWFHAQDPRLKEHARKLIGSGEHECWYSVVSLWEITIKHALGKLELTDGLQESFKAMDRANLGMIGIERGHLLALSTLPPYHGDPFDRMLIAQAKHEGMHVLTSDAHFQAYGIPLLEA